MSYASFQLATKALIFNGNSILILRKPGGRIDFPGGRIDDTEYELPYTKCLERELLEELGAGFECKIGNMIFAAKRNYEHNGMHYIATIFYRCEYINGDVNVSDEHEDFEWIDYKALLKLRKEFVSDTEYSELQAYLKV